MFTEKMGSCLRRASPNPFLLLFPFLKGVRLEIFWHIVLQPLSHCTYISFYIRTCSHTPICIHLSTTAAFYLAAASNFCHWPSLLFRLFPPCPFLFLFILYFSLHFFVVFAYQWVLCTWYGTRPPFNLLRPFFSPLLLKQNWRKSLWMNFRKIINFQFSTK